MSRSLNSNRSKLAELCSLVVGLQDEQEQDMHEDETAPRLRGELSLLWIELVDGGRVRRAVEELELVEETRLAGLQ